MKPILVVFDIDGTAVEARPDAQPSKRLIEVITRLLSEKPYIHLACATGRTFPWAKSVTIQLGLIDPCIVSAGTQIVDPKTGKEVWSKRLTSDGVASSLSVLISKNIDTKILTETDTPDTAKIASQLKSEPYLLLDVQDIEPTQVEEVVSRIKSVADVEIAKVDSPRKGYINLHITDKYATKEHAVDELRSMLGIELNNSYGIGDGYNDIHLFNSVGNKIAMGNSVQELKSVADKVIGNLEDDGLAEYLESFLIK